MFWFKYNNYFFFQVNKVLYVTLKKNNTGNGINNNINRKISFQSKNGEVAKISDIISTKNGKKIKKTFTAKNN